MPDERRFVGRGIAVLLLRGFLIFTNQQNGYGGEVIRGDVIGG